MIPRHRTGTFVVTPTRLRDWVTCPRRDLLRHRMGLAPSDADGDDPFGSLVHDELARRHDEGAGTCTPEGGVDRPHMMSAIYAAADRHGPLCPGADGARYVGSELTWRWFVRRKAVLLSGRVDAVWEWPDRTIEVRDYKTGRCPADLGDDVAAGLYALLARAQFPGRPVRVTYERLGGEPGVVSLDADADWLRSSYDRVMALADALRAEQEWAPRPHPGTCTYCPWRSRCPESLACEDGGLLS